MSSWHRPVLQILFVMGLIAHAFSAFFHAAIRWEKSVTVFGLWEQVKLFVHGSLSRKKHDRKFLAKLSLPAGSMVTMDRAYNYYRQFAEWTEEVIFFVTRQKKNAKAEVIETIYESSLTDKDSEAKSCVMKEEHIHLNYKEKKELKTLCLRICLSM